MLFDSFRECNSKLSSNFRFYLAFCILYIFIPECVWAASNNPLAATMCNVINIVTGGFGKAIATVAIFAIAIGAFLGKVSWGVVLMTVIGIGALFGATQLVNMIAGGDEFSCDDYALLIDVMTNVKYCV